MAQTVAYQLLLAWRSGQPAALDQLTPLVIDELRLIAHRYMRRERPQHTLQPTALVNEAFVRLAGDQNTDWESRSHFIAIAANHMRRILVDYARERKAAKRGGGQTPETLLEAHAISRGRNLDILVLNDAMDRLGEFDRRKMQAVELRYFGGLEHAEIAAILGIHEKTVQTDLKTATAWLRAELETTPPSRTN